MVDLSVAVRRATGRSRIGPGISGSSGVWANVTPAGITLESGGDNFGVQDILGDPLHAGTFYAFTCFQGCWQSTDYGLSWAKVSTGGGPLDGGKAWGEAMAPDGSYMLASSGNNFTQYGGADGRKQAFKSTNGGVTWTAKGNLGFDPYNFDIEAGNSLHVITTFHDSNHLSESTDGGESWTDQGAMGTSSVSGYVHFLDSTHVLQVSQGGGAEGCWLGTKSGTWSWSLITDLAGNEHEHGAHQIYVDVPNGFIFSPGLNGIWKSTNGGSTWTRVSTVDAQCIVRTSAKFYAATSFPISSGTYNPALQHATAPAGTSFTNDSTPGGMKNGPKSFATGTDGTRWVVLGGMWNAGIWRYVE